ncbi:MAG: hypothetical protein PHF86_05180 [Candidatus Nanoarchaeia archaeon]|jgi:hypothetical protein|nr:hypothetical protein [Candidatus Nanoarchaeia archaeon]
MANANKFTTPTAPTTTPDYIPKTVVYNGSSVPVTYGQLPGGGYGYGRVDPTTNMLVALVAADMIADNMTMAHHGYGEWDNYGKPIRHTPVSGTAVLITFLVIIGVIVCAAIFLRKKFS